jgi:hypothetical protein
MEQFMCWEWYCPSVHSGCCKMRYEWEPHSERCVDAVVGAQTVNVAK